MKRAALETIDEDEDFVTTLTTLHGPIATTSTAFKRKAKRGRRRRSTTMSHHETHHRTFASAPSASDPVIAEVVFTVLWDKIGSLTKSSLRFHLGQLAKVTARRQNDSKNDVMAVIEFILRSAALREDLGLKYAHMTPFMAMLRDEPIGTILEMKALAETKMKEDCESMSVSLDSSSRGLPDVIMFDVPPNEGP